MSKYLSSQFVCCFTLVLGLLGSHGAHAATYTLFGANSKQMSGPVQLGYVQGSGTATGPASHSGSLMVLPGAFAKVDTTFQFFPTFPGFAQVAASLTTSQTRTETLKVGSGPGGFEFCPPIGHPLNPTCNQAKGIEGYLGFQGFVDYDAGVSQFGGTFRLARKSQTVVAFRIATGPSQFAHQLQVRGAIPAAGGGPTTFRSPYFTPTPSAPTNTPIRADWAPGLPTVSQYIRATPGVVTISPVLHPTGQWIQTRGPAGTATPFTPAPSTSTGFPFTTGMVRMAGVTSQGGLTAPMVTGANYRGPDGQGNIVLVAGGINQSRAGNSVPTYAIMTLGLVDTTMPEPAMGLGMVAGIVLLVLVGAARRRRG